MSLCSATIVAIAAMVAASARVCESQNTQPTTGAVAVGSWTVDKICAAIAWRESKIKAGSSFRFTEQCWTVKPDRSEKSIMFSDLAVRYKYPAVWFAARVTDPNAPEWSHERSYHSWDGSVCTTLIEHVNSAGKKTYTAGIQDHEPNLLGITLFFHVLGLRVGSYPFGESEWLNKELAMPKTTATVTEDWKDGEHCVRLLLLPADEPSGQVQYCFLPGKDFLMKDRIFRSRAYAAAKVESIDQYHVRGMTQRDDFWMPEVCDVTLTSSRAEDRMECKLLSFSATPPTDDEMSVRFPNGTEVMDDVNHQAYFVQPDGTKQFEQFFDAATGKSVRPASQPSGTN